MMRAVQHLILQQYLAELFINRTTIIPRTYQVSYFICCINNYCLVSAMAPGFRTVIVTGIVKPLSHFPLSCSILAGSVSPTFFLNSVLKIRRSCWPLGLFKACIAINMRSGRGGGSKSAIHSISARMNTARLLAPVPGIRYQYLVWYHTANTLSVTPFNIELCRDGYIPRSINKVYYILLLFTRGNPGANTTEGVRSGCSLSTAL